MYGRGPPQQGYQQQGGQGWPQQQSPQNGYNQFQAPPPHFQQGGGPPRHAGIGSHGQAPNLPAPPHLPRPPVNNPYGPAASGGFPGVVPSQAWNGEKFSLFVGSIADGVDDGWLERILGTAGPVLSLRRPSPPFAFVEYGDPESVLRCLEVVNGVTIKGKTGGEKALLVKADEKTQARLSTYEESRVKNEQTAEYISRAQEDLAAIISRMNAGDTPSTSALDSADAAGSQGQGARIPSHLQDLAPEELPENHREMITGEIAIFRERAAKLAAEKRQREQQRDMGRGGPSGPTPSGNGWGSRGGQPDPQSYNKPIAFAGAGQVKQEDKAVEPVIDDAQRERERAERAFKEAEYAFKDRERRYEQRERARIGGYEREKARERAVADQEDRDRVFMRERLADWDDDREAEKGREAFYSDRQRWRAQRKPFRARELEADARDRALEAEQLARASKDAESFLDQQADLLAAMNEGKLKTATGDEPAVKLSFGAASKPVVKAPAPVRAAAFGSADDDDEGKKKRALIPLSYSDDEDTTKPAKSTLSRGEQVRKAKEIEDGVPKTKEALWDYHLRWPLVTEDLIEERIARFANKTIVEYLGGEEEELLNAVTSHLRSHKSASELVEELEPVLDEEATEFVIKVWKKLVYEVELAKLGISL